MTRLSFHDVFLHVHRREVAVGATVPADSARLNERLLCVLTACHEVNTARRRLMGALDAQHTLNELKHLLGARICAGLCAPAEPPKLVAMRADVSRSVEVATDMWDMAGRHFTRVTRLLPAQLEEPDRAFVPLTPGELDWLEREAARLGMSGPFKQARETYRLAVMDRDMVQSQWARASAARHRAEAGFRSRARGALAFAEAVITQHWHGHSLASREAHCSMRGHALYATLSLLPQQLRWC